jgi:membrane-bound lytic murein transglycosylase D
MFFTWGCATSPPASHQSIGDITVQSKSSHRKPNADISSENPAIASEANNISAGNRLSTFSNSAQKERSSRMALISPPSPQDIEEATEETVEEGTSGCIASKMGSEKLDEALEYCDLSQELWQKGELDNALDMLDHAYELILEVDTENDPVLIQQKEDLRYTISKRTLEIYASRHIVVNGQHNAIPMVMNKYVQNEIHLLTVTERQFFIDAYRRSGRFRPNIVEALRENGLPEELSWLPLIESGFKMRALSSARALGLWQFIPSTGYKFGLQRDMFIDERLDPDKATTAAISYLKELHQIFGDWTTVLAAYNCGEGRVLRVIRNQNINYLDNFWDLYKQLPMETARYVPRFLATLHILNDPQQYGLEDELTLDAPPEYETCMLSRQVHLKNVANIIATPEHVIRDLNPELRYGILPDAPYQLKLPVGTVDTLSSQIDSIPLAKPQPPPTKAFSLHQVRSGETLSRIATRYKTTIHRLKKANGLRGDCIVPGQRLKIPQPGAVLATASSTSTGGKRRTATHTVRQGDSLWNIARRYGTTTQEIQALNNMKGSRLVIGQRLKLYSPKKGTQSRTSRIYVVQKGDNLSIIAQKLNTSLAKLLHANQFNGKSKIYPGQKIYID